MTSLVNSMTVSQRGSTTFSSVWEASFRNPLFRISFQICSMGFISGVYGGIDSSCIFSGTIRPLDLCHAAPSQHRKIISSAYVSERVFRNTFIHAVLQYGSTRKRPSPEIGSTAPYKYMYSRMWWHGTDGRVPFLHQQYFGVLIRPKPASS